MAQVQGAETAVGDLAGEDFDADEARGEWAARVPVASTTSSLTISSVVNG
ncbi:hypothetical protein [Streptomyces sp. NBC_00057]